MRTLPALALLVVSACGPRIVTLGPPKGMEPPPFREVHSGLLLTSGAEIAAEDGSFRIVANSQFQTPFHQNNNCLVSPTAEAPGAGELSGARRVRVTVPGRSEPLYGLLSLCGAPPEASGATANRYTLEVPESYVNETSGGRVSVVYESHRDQTNSDLDAKSWILWLSAMPFPQPHSGEALVTPRTIAMSAPNPEYQKDQVEANRLGIAYGKERGMGTVLPPVGAVITIAGIFMVTSDNVGLIIGGAMITGAGIGCILGGGIAYLSSKSVGRKIDKLEKKYSVSDVDLVPYADQGGGGLLLSGSF